MNYSIKQFLVSIIILGALGIGFGIIPLPDAWTSYVDSLKNGSSDQTQIPVGSIEGEGEHIPEYAPSLGNKEVSEYTDLDVLNVINEERAKFELPPLVFSVDLERSSRQKVEDMVANNYFAHERDGKVFEDFIKAENYDYVIIGENLARGEFKSAQRLVRAWLGSPNHRKNILNVRYQETGIAILPGTHDGQPVYYIAEHFGTPRSVCLNVTSVNANKDFSILQQVLRERGDEVASLKHTLSELTETGFERNKLLKLYQTKMNDLKSIEKTLQQKIEGEESLIQAYNSCIQKYQE